MRPPTALTIAGSDSGGGAGIQADLKTFLDHGVYGMSVVCALTAQNTRGVHAIWAPPPAFVRAQLDAVFSDLPVDAVKIGMIGGVETLREVAAFFRALSPRPPIVLDPVTVAKGGHPLLAPEAVAVLRAELVPLATLVTPNVPEAAALGPLPVPVLRKGGHAEGDTVTDTLSTPGAPDRHWRHRRLRTPHTHGTGCTLSAAIAARLARGEALEPAVAGAIRYVARLIARSQEGLGGGHGPLWHGHLGRPR
jgi:hydroxymethylpyrimidine/phosphomethylpyrimidine kinase